jgi:cytochrome c oxidase assembly protein subunit 15
MSAAGAITNLMEPTNPWLTRFAKVLVAATFCLIFLGGMVTSVNAGLSVPDWPTSYGYNMFTFPITRWVGGIFFEHTHRLLATCVGLMTTVLVAWIWRNRWAVPAALAVSAVATGTVAISLPHVAALSGPGHALTRGLIIMHVNIWSFAAAFAVMLLTTEKDRWGYGKPWLQWLGFGAFLLVCVQGTLGGLRVTEVSTVLAIIHACTAQAFLCLTVVMAAALSPRWDEGVFAMRASRQGISAVKGLAWTLVGAVYCQLMIGAVMRHLHAGLSIPDFPLAFGRLIPPMINERVAIHFAHRVGALVVTVIAVTLAVVIFTSARVHTRLTRPALGLMATLTVQVALGASVVWLRRDPVITSLHVVNGAAVLTMALLLAMRATKLKALLKPPTQSWTPVSYQEASA